MADMPGNGSTSPFGNGDGNAAGGSAVGNNFLTNPGGVPAKTGGGQPASYGESRPQQSGSDPDINEGEIPAGGKELKADPQPDPGNPIGVGSISGGGGKPFKGV